MRTSYPNEYWKGEVMDGPIAVGKGVHRRRKKGKFKGRGRSPANARYTAVNRKWTRKSTRLQRQIRKWGRRIALNPEKTVTLSPHIKGLKMAIKRADNKRMGL